MTVDKALIDHEFFAQASECEKHSRTGQFRTHIK
jgi:hypothetical protein